MVMHGLASLVHFWSVSRPIVIKLHMYNGKGYKSFMSACIGHMVAIPTYSFHRLAMGNL